MSTTRANCISRLKPGDLVYVDYANCPFKFDHFKYDQYGKHIHIFVNIRYPNQPYTIKSLNSSYRLDSKSIVKIVKHK